MQRLEHVQVGQPITAEGYNNLVDVVNVLAESIGVNVDSPRTQMPQRFDLVEIMEEEEAIFGSGDIKPGMLDKTVSVLTLDTAAHPGDDQWKWAGYNHLFTMDPQLGVYLAGERHLVCFLPAAGERIPIPGVLIHVARAEADLTVGADGDVEIQRWDEDDEEWTNSGITVAANNLFGGSIDADTKIVIFQHLQSRRWLIFPPAFNPPTRTCGDPVFTE